MDNRARVLEHLLQFSGLVQIGDNIAPSHELSVDEQLGERRPVPMHEQRAFFLTNKSSGSVEPTGS